jgi:hypothetical protein
LEKQFKASIVWLILNGRTEEALTLLAKRCDVSTPNIGVGLPKGSKRKTLGCYSARSKTITVLNSDILKEPLVILHEFYHHLRTTVDAKHKGTERLANDFAKEFIEAYRSTAGKDDAG